MSNRLRAGRLSFGIRHLLVLVALVAAVLGVWNWLIRWPSLTISGAEILKEQLIRLETSGTITRLRVNIPGDLIGEASLTDPWGKMIIVGPGKFALTENQDYYETIATVRYSPKTVTSGSITVRYNFDSG